MLHAELRTKASTCLTSLAGTSADHDDQEQLTAKEELCQQPDSDDDYSEYPDDDDFDADIYRHETFLQRFFLSNHCTVCMYFTITLIIVGSIVALIVITVQVVLPYRDVEDFLNGTCFPRKVSVEFGETCLCGTGCTAKYRCLQIKVMFQDRHKVWQNATMYDDESTLGKKCSFYPPCKTSPSHVQQSVDVYEHHYAVVGLPFNCWYHPQQGRVIRTKRFHLYHVVNGILWTVIVLLMSATGLLCLWKKRGCEYVQ